MSDAKKTTDRNTVQQWVEARSGYPATVKSTEKNGEPGLLRIEFDDSNNESLEKISWSEFFDKFEKSNLAFLYQEELKSGEESRFCKLVSRD